MAACDALFLRCFTHSYRVTLPDDALCVPVWLQDSEVDRLRVLAADSYEKTPFSTIKRLGLPLNAGQSEFAGSVNMPDACRGWPRTHVAPHFVTGNCCFCFGRAPRPLRRSSPMLFKGGEFVSDRAGEVIPVRRCSAKTSYCFAACIALFGFGESKTGRDHLHSERPLQQPVRAMASARQKAAQVEKNCRSKYIESRYPQFRTQAALRACANFHRPIFEYRVFILD